VVVSGMGSLNDCFLARASRVLGTLELAHRYDIPAALLSQGLGPLQDPGFKQTVERALTNVDLIALRERLSGPVLLEQMGVSPEVVRVTGDDAIELAYDARPDGTGSCLGINVRVAGYAGVDDTTIATVRSVLRDAAARLDTHVLPIPISHRHSGLDVKANRALLRDIDPASDGGATLVTPLDVVHQVGRCRLVIAGSYHAAVFALAQGIPAVALVNSPYYADKFLGLEDMFGSGCEIVRISDRRFPETLADAIDRGWASAEQCRPRLLAAAAGQVELGYQAYQDLLPLPTERTRGVGQQVRRAK
jgi:polysaccharide pyruvyl transferase WcaK-like protein